MQVKLEFSWKNIWAGIRWDRSWERMDVDGNVLSTHNPECVEELARVHYGSESVLYRKYEAWLGILPFVSLHVTWVSEPEQVFDETCHCYQEEEDEP